MFNTGDKVRIKDTATLASRYEVGDIATIIENVSWLSDEGGQTVKIEMEDGNTQFVRVSQLEAVVSTTYKAKAGDKIRITHPFMASGYQEGDCFTVERADANGVWVDGNHGFIANFEFEVLPESAAKSSTGIKVGDKVKVTQVVARLSGSYKVGDVLTVKETYANHPGYITTDNGLLSPKEYTVITDEIVDLLEKVQPESKTLTDGPHPEFKAGDKFVVVNPPENCGLKVGDVITLDENDNTRDPWFMLNGHRYCENWENLAPVEAEPTQVSPLYRQPYPHFVEGTSFRVVRVDPGDVCKVEDVVVLHENDNTSVPWFKLPSGSIRCLFWDQVAPIETKHRYTEEQEQEAREIVYRLMTRRDPMFAVQICTVPGGYLDSLDRDNKDRSHTIAILLERMYEKSKRYWREAGRAVAYCSPDDEWSDDIGRMVALCKLLDKPLPSWIHG